MVPRWMGSIRVLLMSTLWITTSNLFRFVQYVFLDMVLLSMREYSMAHNLLGASTHGWAAVWWWLTHHRLIGWYRHKLSCGTKQNIYYSSWKRQIPSTINFTAKGDCAGIKINVFSRESSRVESTHSLRHSRTRKDAEDGGENPAGIVHHPQCTTKNKQATSSLMLVWKRTNNKRKNKRTSPLHIHASFYCKIIALCLLLIVSHRFYLFMGWPASTSSDGLMTMTMMIRRWCRRRRRRHCHRHPCSAIRPLGDNCRSI